MTTALAAGCLGSGVGSWCRGLHGHAKSDDPSLNQGNPRTSIAATWFSHVCQLSSTRKPTTAEPWQSSPTERRRPLEQATPATVLKHLCHAVNEVRAGIPPESPPAPPPPPRRFCNGLDLGAFQGKSNLGLDAQMALKARPLLSRAVLKGFCGFMKPKASKTKHEELPRCAILGHVDARTHVSCSSSSSKLGGRCAEGCQEALCGREDCPQGLQVGGGGVCGVQRVRGPKVG